jgi:hypothetical protein
MKLLKDPGNTRVCKDVPLPPQIPLSSRTIFKDNGYIDWMYLKKFI